jgi:hypothetical protein
MLAHATCHLLSALKNSKCYCAREKLMKEIKTREQKASKPVDSKN